MAIGVLKILGAIMGKLWNVWMWQRVNELFLVGLLIACSDSVNYQDQDLKRQDESGFRLILGGSVIDARDGQRYHYLRIGQQNWFIDNLNYELKGYSKCWRAKREYCDSVGRLYPMDKLTLFELCPTGWHVPAKEEWLKLGTYLMEQNELEQLELNSRAMESSYNGWQEGEGEAIEGNDQWIAKNIWWTAELELIVLKDDDERFYLAPHWRGKNEMGFIRCVEG